MLDFSLLRTPPGDGDILVEPSGDALAALAESNQAILASHRFRMLDGDAGQWRAMLRKSLVGVVDAPVIMTGHQPDFIHAGVWAKNVIAGALAGSFGTHALNVVVDSDTPAETLLDVPTVRDDVPTVQKVRYPDIARGAAFESIPRMRPDEIDVLTAEVRDLLGRHYEASCLPVFFAAFRGANDANEWVGQMIQARCTVERGFGVELIERRASRDWFGPLTADLLLNAPRFRDCHNAALADYRRTHRVRSANRPIPDLAIEDGRLETPVWVYRQGTRRRRLFTERQKEVVRLYADAERIGDIAVDRLSRWDQAREALIHLDGNLLRPRALSLTLWARMLAGDLFIHGIGGAKYDRITDDIIRRYFGVEPPAMACVSATLRMDLSDDDVDDSMLREAQALLRDIRFNPQRHVRPTAEVESLIAARRRAAERAADQKARHWADREGRRRTFDEIRDLNDRLTSCQPSLTDAARSRVVEMMKRMEHLRIANRRDYFFAMMDRGKLRRLYERLAEQVPRRV